jgi:hypothetical protein
LLLALVILAAVAIGLFALPTHPASAQAGGEGKIEGQIENGTKDAKPSSTAGLTVTMYTVFRSSSDVITTTTKSDANGKFAFSNLATISSTAYIVSANYSGVDYYSNFLQFTSAASNTLTTTIPIFETTTDPKVLRINQTHLIIDVQPPWLAVQQIVVVENTSDHVFLGAPLGGDHYATLQLPILPKAISIQFDDANIDSAVLRGESVLTYTLPLGPGQDQIVYSYAVPFNPPTYDVSLQLPYDTAKFGLYMADVGGTIESAQLVASAAPIGGAQGAPKFIGASTDQVVAGTTIKASLKNLPAAATSAAGTPVPGAAPAAAPKIDNNRLIGSIVLGVAAVAALGLLTYPVWRRRRHARVQLTDEEERAELLQAIADLDDEFEAGKIAEAEYNEERAALKAELLELGE